MSKIDIYDVEPIQLKARVLSEGSERHGQAAYSYRPWKRRLPVPAREERDSGRGAQRQAGLRQGRWWWQVRRASPRARQEPAEGEDLRDMRCRDPVPRALDPSGKRTVRRESPLCRHRDRNWGGARQGVYVRGQRCDRKGRLVLPDDSQEAHQGAGDRRGEQSALHLSGRLGGRLPADAGRGLPRQAALRSYLPQPGHPLQQGDPASGRRARLVHRRRRLHPGDV